MDAERKNGRGIDWVALWILFSAWCSLAGWLLSWLGCLNRGGYGIAFILFFGGLILFRKQLGFSRPKPVFFRVVHSRWLLPKIWLVLAILAFLGGALYHPNNYDYLTYRFPRVLHWCWEQKWHWIDTVNQRMNYSGTGFEWMMVPLFVLFKTDRLFFLINFVPFLFLPGLIFSVFCGLGISRRVSWWWMWVLPSGYCYLLQAASTGNDSVGAVYLLASLHYAFKTRDSSAAKNFILSSLAIALLTDAKASNMPLALPWLIAVFFNRQYFLRQLKPVVLAAILFMAGTVSFLPLALLNIHYTGDYSGDPENQGNLKVHDPISGIMGNSIQLAVFNLAPSIWPSEISWDRIIPAVVKERLKRDFPRLATMVDEMQIEEKAGVGLGVIVGVGLMAGCGFWARFNRTHLRTRSRQAIWITAGALVALLVYMSKMGSEATSRLIAAYYPLIIAGVLVLASLDGSIVRHFLFKLVGSVVMLSALPLVIFCASRPLFPVHLAARYLAQVAPSDVARFDQVYGVYSLRFDALRDLRGYLPKNETEVGLLQTGDDPESSLWQPFGSRKVIDVSPQKSADELKAEHLHFIVVAGEALEYKYHLKIDDLTKQWSANIVVEKHLAVKAHNGPQAWYLLYCP